MARDLTIVTVKNGTITIGTGGFINSQTSIDENTISYTVDMFGDYFLTANTQSEKNFNSWTGTDLSYLANPASPSTILHQPGFNLTFEAIYVDNPLKVLDKNGAEQLNQLLAIKFDTKVDKVLNTKTYENILGTASDTSWTQNTFYFASVRPTSFTDMWSIKYRISVWVESDSNFNAVSDCFFRGDQSGISAYSCFNNIHSTSYRPAYYHTMYRLLEAGFDEGYGHAIGVSLKDANSKDTVGKERTIKVELLEQINCTVTLLDTPLKWGDWPGISDTNYNGATGNPTSYNFSANGLQETGDANDNTIAYTIKNYYEKPIIGAGNVFRNNLCTYDTDWKIQGFVKSNSTGTSKQKNTATFRIGMPIFYLNSTSNQTVGSVVADNILCTQMQTVDFRYSSNCGATLVQNQPVFLVGIPDGDTFTLADTWWTQTLPSTEDGKIYIYLGNAYSTNKYSIAFQLYHPIYWYKNGAIRLYTDDTNYMKPTGGIPKTDLASDVQTSLGKADTALQNYTETDPTVPSHVKTITSTDISNWNAKGTYSKPSGGIPKTDLASAVQTSLGLADTALQSYTETDPTVPSHVKNITSTDISNWNAKGTGTITGVSVNGTSVATSGVANITSVPASILNGAIPSAVTATTQSASDNSTKIATTAFVQTAIDNLPEPMVFKGSLGTGGTITTLPTNGTANIGDTYKVITAGTYASKAAKIGDTFICLTKTSSANTWELIPSGDEPSGTVTSITIKATSPISIDSTSAITTSGTRTLSHAASGVTAGTYRSVTVNDTGHVTAGTNPTTISGYGITDAKIASGTITLGNNTITPLTSSSTLDATKVSGTLPANTYTDTKNTAGATNSSSKLYLIGAESQATNPQTYSDDEVFVQDGVISAQELTIGSRKSGTTIGTNSLSQGYYTTASGQYAHAEGYRTTASGDNSHTEGVQTTASGYASHAEGSSTQATSYQSHAEGSGTEALESATHAEGQGTIAKAPFSHTEGYYTKVEISGQGGGHAEGCYTYVNKRGAHAEGGDENVVNGGQIVSWDQTNLQIVVSGIPYNSNNYQYDMLKIANYSIDNDSRIASGSYDSSTGYYTFTISKWGGWSSLAIGSSISIYITNKALGWASHSEGTATRASGNNAHAEGLETTASNSNSHAEGSGTIASGNNTHAEGYQTTASGDNSHAEGYQTTASSQYSHAEGNNTTASGWYSHAEGYYVTAQRKSQHTQGEYNILDTSGTAWTRGMYAHIIGNGTADDSRSNAHTLDWSGNAWYAGDVYVGSTSGTNKDSGSKKLATEDFVTSKGYVTTDTKNTAGSTDSSSKLYLIGATSQSANPQTYSDDEVYVTSGALNTKILTVGTRKSNTTVGTNSSSEGYNLEASGMYSHAEGQSTIASGNSAHAENSTTTASGTSSHAEGSSTVASGQYSHAEGRATIAQGIDQHVQGIFNIAQGSASGYSPSDYIHIVGNGTDSSNRSNAYTLTRSGEAWFAGDVYTGSTSGTNKDSGSKKLATEDYVTSQGYVTTDTKNTAGATSTNATLYLIGSISQTANPQTYTSSVTIKEGKLSCSSLSAGSGNSTGDYSVAEGYSTKATANQSHAEGCYTEALGQRAHAEGYGSIAAGGCSHAEGDTTIAIGESSHSEGSGRITAGKIILSGAANATTYTTSDTSNAKVGYRISGTVGIYITAISTNQSITLNKTLSSSSAISNKEYTITTSVVASNSCSHAEGFNTYASRSYQHVQGKYNIIQDSSSTLLLDIIGNGSEEANRSNAYTLDVNGNGWFSGDVYVGSTGGKNKDSGSKKLATEEYVTTRGYITTDTKNTAGSTDISSKIYLVGATEQSTNPQTYSDNEVYTTNGTLTAKEFSLGTNAKIVYNTSESCIEFNFS